MTTHVHPASDSPSAGAADIPGHLHAMPMATTGPGDALIQEQIRETVRRETGGFHACVSHG